MSAEVYISGGDAGNGFDNQDLDGQLADGPVDVKHKLSQDYNHLDEPILDTLLRDLMGIYQKMKIIALPLSSYDIHRVVFRGWDLWGPLLLCTFLAFNLHHSNSHEDNRPGPQFANIFVLVWFGSCVVSLNYRLLSLSSVRNRQVSKLMHYSRPEEPGSLNDPNAPTEDVDNITGKTEPTHKTLLSPPSIFQLMCVFGYCLVAPCFGLLLLRIFSLNQLIFERIIIGLLFGFAWPTICSVRILIRYQHPNKRTLAIYPIGLFYLTLSCMIILNH